MPISKINYNNYNCTYKNNFSKPSFGATLDKRELIDNLIRQRNAISIKFKTHTPEEYLTYAKNCCEIEPTKRIRQALFQNKIIFFPTKEMRFLDRIISKSKLPQDTILYRCCTPCDFGLPITSKEFIDTYYKKGDYFKNPVYSRTTLRKNFAKYYAREIKKANKGITDKPIFFKIYAPKGTNGIFADELPDILPRVISQMEEEIILPRNSIFRFRTRSEHSNYEQIDVDLISSWFKVPFFTRIHNFRLESNFPPVEYKKSKNVI